MGKCYRDRATTAAPTMGPFLRQDGDFLGEQEFNDLSYWELVNESDADSDDDSLLSLEDGFVTWYSVTVSSLPEANQVMQTTQKKIHEDPDLIDHKDSRDDHGRECDGDVHNYHQFHVGPIIFPDTGDRYEQADGYEEEEEEAEDGYGLDDELVPWHVNGKLGRQRMRKLGKRSFAKMGNSKRNPYLHVKPGCVHGKHGLGMKA